MTYPHSGEVRRAVVNASKQLVGAVDLGLNAVSLDQDRASTIVNKAGANNVAIDIDLTHVGTGSFDASGTIKVLAGNSPTLTEADALQVPTWPVTTDEKVKLELETGYDYVGLFFAHSSGGEKDRITGSISVS